MIFDLLTALPVSFRAQTSAQVSHGSSLTGCGRVTHLGLPLPCFVMQNNRNQYCFTLPRACLVFKKKKTVCHTKQYLIIHNNNLVMLKNDYRRHRRTDPADTFYNPKFMSCSLLYGREMTWKVGGLTRYHLAPVLEWARCALTSIFVIVSLLHRARSCQFRANKQVYVENTPGY